MALRWDGGGYRVLAWRVYRVDRESWADAGVLTSVTSVSVSRDVSSEHSSIERGSMSVDMEVSDTFEEGYYRIAMLAEQDGSTERVDVATLLCGSTSDTVNRGMSDHSIEGKSVLDPASTTLLQTLRGSSHAPSGIDAAAWAGELLDEAINAPVRVTASFTLDDAIVFDDGCMVLEAVWQVLDAGGAVMQIAGDGTVSIIPKPTEPSLDLDWAHARLVQPEFSRNLDYGSVHNRYFAVDGESEASAINDDPNSVTSTVSRGWYSDIRDTSPTRVDGESLQAYCERRLEEDSMVEDMRGYVREWWPGVLPFSVVRGSLTSVGMEGDFRVVSQQITCDRGIVVEERSSKEVYAWRRG